MNRVVIHKVQSLQRCVARAREEYAASAENFASDYTRQDAAVLNVVRACELAIDLANHIVSVKKLGIPSSNREAFETLCNANLIPQALCPSLFNMVSFRNIAVHTYQTLDLGIVVEVIQNKLDDVIQFADIILDLDK